MFTQFATHRLRTGTCIKSMRVYSKSMQHEVKEIEIPVPWGKVVGKFWGPQDKQPILALHGWQDNAASFDNIAPLIRKNTSILALDLPGHGLSSWIPPGFMYSELVYLLLFKRIKKHFGWEKIKIMAHSLSTMVTYWYAATFPTDLQYVIALDVFKPVSTNASRHTPMFRQAVEEFFILEKNNVQPSYMKSEILKKISAGYGNLDESSSEILMTRGITPKGDGTYVVNRDPRVRVAPIYNMFSQAQLEEYANLITCPYLIIKGDPNFYYEDKQNFYTTLEILKANTKVQFETLPATHYLHLTHPVDTAAIINPFLEKYD